LNSTVQDSAYCNFYLLSGDYPKKIKTTEVVMKTLMNYLFLHIKQRKTADKKAFLTLNRYIRF